MCVYFDAEPKLRTATEDIVTYKVVCKRKSYLFGLIKGRKVRSLIKDFPYKIGKICGTIITTASTDRGIETRTGFYSWGYKPVLNKYEKEHYDVVECIIPEGSEYYLEKYSDTYVSNSIKLVKIL